MMLSTKPSLFEVGERLIQLFHSGEATLEEVNFLLAERDQLLKSTDVAVLHENALALTKQDQELLQCAQDYFGRLRTLMSLRHKSTDAIRPAARFMDFRA